MTDDIDKLNELMPTFDHINQYKSKRDVPDIAQAIGYCLNCGEPIEDRRWCDADCRNDWERLN